MPSEARAHVVCSKTKLFPLAEMLEIFVVGEVVYTPSENGVTCSVGNESLSLMMFLVAMSALLAWQIHNAHDVTASDN